MSERLDRIESILDRIAQRQEESDRHFEERQQNFEQGLEETKAIVQSNGRAIQAMLERQESERLEHEDHITRIDTVLVKLTEVQQGMAKWLANVDDTQPTILRRLMSIENKIDRILDPES